MGCSRDNSGGGKSRDTNSWSGNTGAPLLALGRGGVIWLLGIASALSFNIGSEFKLFGNSLFDLLGYLTTNIMTPISGLLIALLVGWVISKTGVMDELELGDRIGYRLRRFVIRYIAPIGVAVVFIYNLTFDLETNDTKTVGS